MRKSHGLSQTRIYAIYQEMKNRCHSPKTSSYKNYGAKGITVCDEWRNDFMAFYTWSMENNYKEDLTIDRKDSKKGYEPSNCRWITMHENILNQERNSNRNKSDLYIYNTSSGDFRVDISKGTKKNRKCLYAETFYTKVDAMKARDLFLKTGEQTRHKKHEFGTSKKIDISGFSKRKQRADRRKELLLNKPKAMPKTLKISIEIKENEMLIETAKQQGISTKELATKMLNNEAEKLFKKV